MYATKMKILGMSLILFSIVGQGRSQSEKDLYNMFTQRKLRIVCSRGVPFRYRLLEVKCCETYKALMKTYWKNGDRYLSEHLEFLRTWRCPEFAEECEKRTYAFNEFTSLVYDKFCNKSLLEQKCGSEVLDIVGVSHTEATTNVTPKNETSADEVTADGNSERWNKMMKQVNTGNLTNSDLSKPCLQVAQLDSPEGGFGSFQEILSLQLPFCSVVWCGFSRDVVKRGVSLYDCMPKSCQVNVVIIVAVTIILSLAIVISNSFVLIIFSKILPNRNAQTIYKISMAVADLLTGILVMPSLAITLLLTTHQNVPLAPDYTLKMPEFANQFVVWSKVPLPGRDGVTVHAPTRGVALDQKYIKAVGCITTISLLASIYTLTCASIDRLWAVHFPLRYRAYNTKKFAVRLVFATWLLTILISLLPFMGIGLKYGLISSVIITLLGGKNVHIIYICVLVAPIIIVWVSSIVLYCSVRNQTGHRQQLSSATVQQSIDNKHETRLAVILLIMVGVFTLCVLPIAILSIISIALHNQMDPTNFATFQLSRVLLLNSTDYVVGIVLLCNSFWNVVIYSMRNIEFRKALKNIFRNSFHCCFLHSERQGKFGKSSVASSTSHKTESNIQTAVTAVPKSTNEYEVR